jgi:hypothetical protein
MLFNSLCFLCVLCASVVSLRSSRAQLQTAIESSRTCEAGGTSVAECTCNLSLVSKIK